MSTPTPESRTMLIATTLSSATLVLKAYEDELANGKRGPAVADSIERRRGAQTRGSVSRLWPSRRPSATSGHGEGLK